MKHGRSLLLAAVLALLAACGQPPHYQWADYEPALYDFYKHPEKADAYTEKLARAVERGEAEGHVAPGLHAEYGYMLLGAGKTADAVVQFEAEKKRWPESKLLMDRMIRLASGKDGAPAPAAAAPAAAAATNASVKTQ
jgi:hypothetical protein